ncbi:MAG: DUF2142 domain-containing protein [Actinobacteria bacterium]|nr:DUF2142 domain-containing protein [Actinomycetota bacterium]
MKIYFLLMLAYASMITLWAVSTPPGTPPDEYAHYLRAIGAGRGELVLDEKPKPLVGKAAEQTHLRWQRRQSRLVETEASLSPELFKCNRISRPHWDCPQTAPPPERTETLITWVGTYPPYPYVLPGLAMVAAEATGTVDEAAEALVVGRLASTAMVLLLIAAAIFLLYDRRVSWLSMLGLVAAVTPMVVFVGASLSSSGPEIAAGLAFLAGLLRLTRLGSSDEVRNSWLVWLVTGFSAAVLMLSRDLGIAWAALHVGVVAILMGLRPLLTVVRQGGYRAWTGIAVGASGLVAGGFWQLAHQVRPGVDVNEAVRNFQPALSITKEIARQQVGVFGHLEIVMAPGAYVAWGTILVLLGVAALVVGSLRERMTLLLSLVVAWLAPIGLEVAQAQVGFGAQGRHVLPFTVAVPLLAGEILTRHADRLRWLRRLRPTLWVTAVAATTLGYAWYWNAKRVLLGMDGRDPFWEYVPGTPIIDWQILALIMASAVFSMMAFGFVASRTTEAPDMLPTPGKSS